LSWLKKLAWPIAALLALASFLLGRRGGSPKDDHLDELEGAMLETVGERKRRKEVEADAVLAEKRAGSRADRLAGALRRASERLGRG